MSQKQFLTADQFADFCEHSQDPKFDLDDQENYHYKSLPICIVDCVYSLRVKYKDVTTPIVNRYAKEFLDGDKESAQDSISLLLEKMENGYGVKKLTFIKGILNDNHKLGRNNRPKEEVLYDIAKRLKILGIETIRDFKLFQDQEMLSDVLLGIDGFGDAGVNYLFMLAGDPNRCKPDVHIHHAINDARIQNHLAPKENISNDMCQKLFTQALRILKKKYKHKSLKNVRQLDGIIWKAYSEKAKKQTTKE